MPKMSFENLGFISENITMIHQSLCDKFRELVGKDVLSFYENNQKLAIAFGSSVFALATYYTFIRRHDRLKDIPGPPQIPIFGNFLDFRGKIKHIHYEEIARKYGKICRVKLLKFNVVVVSSLEAIQEVLVEKSTDYAGRPGTFRLHVITRMILFLFYKSQLQLFPVN